MAATPEIEAVFCAVESGGNLSPGIGSTELRNHLQRQYLAFSGDSLRNSLIQLWL
jgi:hypothetical protein